MRVKSFFLSVCIGTLLISPLMAGQPEPDTAVPIEDLGNQQPTDCRNAGATLVKLSHFVSLWREANLNDDANRAGQYEMELTDMLRTDIRQCMAQIDKCKQQLCSNVETGSVSTVSAGDLQRAVLLDNMQDADSLLKTKKRLLGAIIHSSAFSNKFRLLGDYMELLRRELDHNAVKVAVSDEDISGDESSPNR